MVGTRRTWMPEQVGCRKGGAFLWSGLCAGTIFNGFSDALNVIHDFFVNLLMIHFGFFKVPAKGSKFRLGEGGCYKLEMGRMIVLHDALCPVKGP